MLWVVVWEYKVEEGDSQMEKQVFGTLCKYLEFLWPHLAHIFFLVSLVALFLGQPLYLNYSTVKEVVKRKTLSLFFLKNTLPKIILLTKRHILGWQILLPYNALGQVEKVNVETQGGNHLLPKIVPKAGGDLLRCLNLRLGGLHLRPISFARYGSCWLNVA